MISDIPFAYWVLPGRFLAGSTPTGGNETAIRERLRRVLACGVNSFIDLTEPGEFDTLPYDGVLAEIAATEGRMLEYRRMAITDRSVPTRALAQEILAHIDHALGSGRTIYLHCFGGIGRTGTIVGSFLAEREFPGDAALAELERRRGAGLAAIASPETGAQRAFVRTWADHPRERS